MDEARLTTALRGVTAAQHPSRARKTEERRGAGFGHHRDHGEAAEHTPVPLLAPNEPVTFPATTGTSKKASALRPL